MLSEKKIFPERVMHLATQLPKDFHGPVRPFPRPRQPAPPSDDRQLQKEALRLNSWKRRKSDREIEQTNRVMVCNPVRTSAENPEWLKSTFFYQQRALQHRKEKDRHHYNILGEQKSQERTDFRRTVFPVFDKTPLKFDWPAPIQDKFAVTSKVGFFGGFSERRASSHSHYTAQREVTPKIGSSDLRDFSMRRTNMKIGHERLIDTGSVF